MYNFFPRAYVDYMVLADKIWQRNCNYIWVNFRQHGVKSIDTVVNVGTMVLTFFQIQLTKGKEGELQTFPTFGCQVFSQKTS